MWISKSDLRELGYGEATIYRRVRDGEWKAEKGKADGREGRPPLMIVLESLSFEDQLKWKRLNEERASAVGASSAEYGDSADEMAGDLTERSTDIPPVEEKLQRYAAALARFSPPEYSLEHRQSVENRCVEMAAICEQVISGRWSVVSGQKLTIKSPGAKEAGRDRAWHPELARLAETTAATDPVYLEMYPSARLPLKPGSLVELAKRYREVGPVAFIRERQTLRPTIDERFLDWDDKDRALATDRLRSSFKSFSSASVVSWGEDWLQWCKRHKVKTPFTDYRPGRPGTCYAWLWRFRKNIPQVAVTLATQGTRGVENTYNYIIRSYDDLSPREGYTMDWKTFDLDVWMDARGAKGKKPTLCRLYVCNVMDLVSKAIFGFTIETVPNARGVTRAYVNAIADAEWKSEPGFELLRGMQLFENKQGFVLWDNGKDFRAQSVEGRDIVIKGFDLETGLMAVLSTHRVGLAIDAQIQVRHSKHYNAKSKIVEPFHSYAIGEWERKMPGFKGRKTEQKPHWYPAARRIHERCFIKGQSPKSEDLSQLPDTWREVYERNKAKYDHGTPFLSADELKAAYVEFLVRYNQQPHGALKNARGEMTPIEYLNLKASAPQMMSPFATTALLMDVRPKPLTVSRGEVPVQWGGIKFLYREVASELSDGTALMNLPMKAQVEFRYDETNVGRGLIMTGGAALCWVEEPRVLGYHASSADFAAANADKKQAQRVAKEYFQTRLSRPDWTEKAEERSNVVPMMIAVGAEEMSEAGEDFEGEEIGFVNAKPAEVAVITRFDRGHTNRGQATGDKGQGLRIVPSSVDDDWDDGTPTNISRGSAIEDDDWVD